MMPLRSPPKASKVEESGRRLSAVAPPRKSWRPRKMRAEPTRAVYIMSESSPAWRKCSSIAGVIGRYLVRPAVVPEETA